MLSKNMEKALGNRSAIREIFEYGVNLAKEIGEENVFDFSLGNPATPAPKKFDETIVKLETTMDPLKLHSYTDNAGIMSVRKAIADNLNKRFATDFDETGIIMQVGAGGAMNSVLRTILDPEDEVLVFAPYFSEYGNYISNFYGKLVEVSPNFDGNLQPNLEEAEKKITAKTKAVIINTPNNPSGVVYTEDSIKNLAALLEKKQKEYGHEIYLISDEPYRELLFGGAKHHFVTKYYDNTFVCYSFSKSLSLPGERIGYVAVPKTMADYQKVAVSVKIATRILGFVNAPALMQMAVSECLEEQSDLAYYAKNRDILTEGLKKAGFSYIEPDGAFYLFLESPIDDEEFCEKAKAHHIMIVPGSSFGCPGYARISYCVATDKIERSLEKFADLAKELGL